MKKKKIMTGILITIAFVCLVFGAYYLITKENIEYTPLVSQVQGITIDNVNNVTLSMDGITEWTLTDKVKIKDLYDSLIGINAYKRRRNIAIGDKTEPYKGKTWYINFNMKDKSVFTMRKNSGDADVKGIQAGTVTVDRNDYIAKEDVRDIVETFFDRLDTLTLDELVQKVKTNGILTSDDFTNYKNCSVYGYELTCVISDTIKITTECSCYFLSQEQFNNVMYIDNQSGKSDFYKFVQDNYT